MDLMIESLESFFQMIRSKRLLIYERSKWRSIWIGLLLNTQTDASSFPLSSILCVGEIDNILSKMWATYCIFTSCLV